jgi:hypothetical protein
VQSQYYLGLPSLFLSVVSADLPDPQILSRAKASIRGYNTNLFIDRNVEKYWLHPSETQSPEMG